MAVTLVGEVVNQCDAATGFGRGKVDTDIFIEPTGSIGRKVSAATTSFATTSLGATAPYDFSGAGGESGFHVIMWFNGLTPLNTTAGMRITVGNGTDRGEWYVGPPTGYTGGFQSRVVNTAADFDLINAGTWTLAGNPAQLTAISVMGGTLQTITSIMGNFNNALIDQITIGEGVRADAGTIGTPNTFETVRTADGGTNFWGWWTSSVGAFVGQGKLFIGPATGTATSVFTDSAQVVLFASANVAAGFYEFNIRGSGTTVTWDGLVIRAESPANARWGLTMDGTSVPDFTDTGSLFQGFDTLTLQSTASLTSTTFDNGNSIIQNSAIISECAFLNSNTADGVALITSDDPSLISDCDFTFSDGHAIEITTAGTYSFSGNFFTGYGADTTNDAAVYNNSGGAVTLNITGGGDPPTVRNGTGATTTVNNVVNFTINNIQPDSEVRIFDASDTTIELAGSESVEGSLTSFTITNAGTGYTAGNTLTLSGGTFTTAAQITVDTVGGGGEITSASITTAGAYSVAPSNPVTLTGGTGASATINATIRGSFLYQYNYTTNTPVIAVVFALGFKDLRIIGQSLLSTDQNIPIQQNVDRVYSNP